MFLSELELVGFKSFADKTTLKFTSGLTAIVGPNGCGKSNIVDAIRWVLGEQRVSVLRADAMQNVIFNGSRTRKPLSMAEVSVTFENSRNLLPTEYTEVRITRRLFRDGESQYLLNRSRCRYRDIQELLMDTGIGANAYSVIELGMIDAILSERHDERRKIFDEAAGVTRYKLRRRETQRRLDALQSDIARIQDLVTEVERSVRSLSRQAKKAERYEQLKQQVLQRLQWLLVHDYQRYHQQRQQLERQIEALQAEKQAGEEALVDQEIAIASLEETLHRAETELARARDQLGQLRSQRQSLEKDLLVTTERIAALQRSQEQLEAEKKRIHQRLQSLTEELQQVQQQCEQLEAAVQQKQQQVDAANAAAVQQRLQLDQQRREVEQLRQQQLELLEYLNKLQAEQEREKTRLETIDRRIEEIQQSMQEQQERREQLLAQLRQLQQQQQKSAAQIEELESQLHREEAKKEQLEQERQHLLEQIGELRSELRHIEAALEFLQNLAVSAESSRFLLEHPEWARRYHPTSFAELLQVPAMYEEAFSSLLEPYLQMVVVSDAAAATAAMALLRSEQKGRASLLVLEQIPAQPDPPPLPELPGVIGYASEIPEVSDPRLRFALRALLGTALIAENAEAAHALLRQGITPIVATTNGTVLSSYGLHRGGSREPAQTALLGRQQKIQSLQYQQKQQQAALEAAQQQLARIEKERQQLRIAELQQQLRTAQQQRNQIEQAIARTESQLSSIERMLQRLHQELEALESDRQHVRQQTERDSSVVEQVQRRKVKLEEELAAAQHDLHQFETAVDQALQNLKALEAALVDLKAQLSAAQLRKDQLEREQQQQQERLEHIEVQKQKMEQEHQQLILQREQIQQQLSQLSTLLSRHQQELEEQEQEVQKLRAQLQTKIRSLQDDQHHLQTLQQELYERQLQLQMVSSRIDRLEEQAQEHFGVSVFQLERPSLTEESDIDVEAIRQQYQELKAKLENFGPVNLLAFEEYKKEKDRLEFLHTQLADLLEAEKTLKTTIQEINRTAVKQFQEVFEQIRKRFQELFQLLFEPGDQADILLEGDDPLEARIEITAKPRGKRPHAIDMLSAGEKTLTAIALLFAIYYVKPSPFCILDEVDAPLDDANIDRFLNLLRDLNEHTQFILITHNKKTMEAADVLYGITMGEDGVSTVVSVRLAEAPAPGGNGSIETPAQR